jgi:hypothetical protein
MAIVRRCFRLGGWSALVALVGVALLSGTAAAAGATGARGAQGDPVPVASSQIRVEHTPSSASGPSGFCLPAWLALRAEPTLRSSSFTLRVTALAPLCEPVLATAAVYAMPGDGVAWPQTLVETAPVVLSGAGVTDVVFRVDCAAAQQFDVVVGPTPAQIAPWGPWHGPLLFPLDTATAHQSHGCGPDPVIPEVPLAVVLPASAALVGGAVTFGVVRRRSAAA